MPCGPVCPEPANALAIRSSSDKGERPTVSLGRNLRPGSVRTPITLGAALFHRALFHLDSRPAALSRNPG